jgi:signal transduction histidine kinase
VKLYRKLLLFTVAAALLPLTAVGFNLLASAERALRDRIAEAQLAAAREAAEAVGRGLGETQALLEEAARTWQPARLSPDELRALPALLCRRSPRLQACGLFDADGRPVVAPVACGDAREGRGPPPMPGPAAEAFQASLPLALAHVAGGALVAAPRRTGPEGRPQLAVAMAMPGRAGATWIAGALVGMEDASASVRAAARPSGDGAVLDAEMTEVAGALAAPLGASDREEARRLSALGRGTGEYRAESGARTLAAWAPVAGTGWGVFLRLPSSVAFAEVAAMRRKVVLASLASLLGLAVLGGLFIRGITRGLARIDAAARQIGAGDLSARLPEAGRDEVAEVSRAFNRMGEELQLARGRLERWNEDLQAQVEARTRELEEAQARLLEAQKLAAIGQLGAGVAHEINNPLTGILGQAQLLIEQRREGDPDLPGLRRIEELSRRSAEITRNLLRFSQQRLEPEFTRLDLNRVVRDTLTLADGYVREAGVALEVALADGLPPVRGDAGHLQQVLLALLSNARTACRDRPTARIAVSTRARNGQVCLSVSDTGKGIAPEVRPRIFEPFFTTKEVWSNVGLGLSVSYRIVAEHGGSIAVDTSPGEGSTFTVVLPAAPAV